MTKDEFQEFIRPLADEMERRARERARHGDRLRLRVTSPSGSEVCAVASEMIRLANQLDVTVEHEFNGTALRADPGDSIDGVVGEWTAARRR